MYNVAIFFTCLPGAVQTHGVPVPRAQFQGLSNDKQLKSRLENERGYHSRSLAGAKHLLSSRCGKKPNYSKALRIMLMAFNPTPMPLRVEKVWSSIGNRRLSYPLAAVPSAASYVLSRSLFLRWFGGTYLIANSVALCQNRPLLGTNGLLPVTRFLQYRQRHGESFWQRPTLMKLLVGKNGGMKVSDVVVDRCLQGLAVAGILLAFPLVITGSASAIQLFALWALYTSLVNVGQRWYAFGWESMLLELGFLSIFLCPLRPWAVSQVSFTPSPVCIWAFRWLLCRIMLGAGLIKLRSRDPCWRDLTAMDYHYETQPIPNPLSPYLHHMPKAWHRFETFVGLWVVEIVAPLLLLFPGGGFTPLGALGVFFRRMSAVIQIWFQFVLILSGNLSFLNWLTIAPAIMCLDDAALIRFIPWLAHSLPEVGSMAAFGAPSVLGRCATATAQGGLAALLLWCSVPVVRNMLSPNQRMNAAFGAWRFVNSYGAFGTVTRNRYEVILEGTTDEIVSPETKWKRFEFIAKPSSPDQALRWLSPWHLRLDWLMWFLPMGAGRFGPRPEHTWVKPFVQKLLSNDKEVSRLLARNPFLEQGQAPRWVRGTVWLYEFAKVGDSRPGRPPWQAKFNGIWMPPVSNQTLYM